MTNFRKKILLLDLGGVVASLGDPVEAIELGISRDEFWSYWLSSPLVRDVETGQMTAAEFLREVANPLGEEPGPNFNARFQQWRIEPFAEIVDSLDAWSNEFRLALLSNTNDIHWQGACASVDFESIFDQLFLSYETGHFKPADEAYTQVIEHYECEPGDIYFLDDAAKNIAAARELGLNAHQVAGAAAVIRTVQEISNA